jgi:amino acid permease
MGAGILGIPIFYKNYGILVSTLLISFFSLVTVYSVNTLIYCHRISKRSGYSMFAKICYGNFGNLLVKLIIIINNFGLCCAYFRIFADVATGIVKAFSNGGEDNFFAFNWHNFFYILLVGVIMFPFIFQDKIDALKVSHHYFY